MTTQNEIPELAEPKRADITQPQPTEKVDVDQLANFIRKVDSENKLGAGALAEQLAAYGYLRAPIGDKNDG